MGALGLGLPSQAMPAGEGRDEVVATLERHRGGASRRASHKALVALGKDGIDPLLELLKEGRISEEPDGALREGERELLWSALAEQPARFVLREARRELDREPSFDGRIFMLQVLESLGTAGELADVLELAGDFEDIELHGKAARSAVRQTLREVLLRDPKSFRNLIHQFRGKHSLTLERILTAAITDTGRSEALDLVWLLMRDRDDLRLAAIDALGDLVVAEDEESYRYATELVAGGLISRDDQIRQHSAISMGKLRSTAYVPVLMDLLDDSSPRVRKRVMWALQETTGFKGKDEKRWKAWYARELDWHFGERGALLEEAYGIYPARQRDSLRRLGHHRVFGAELVGELVTLVRLSDLPVALATVATLHRLADRSCLYPLIGLLEDSRGDVREAVRGVLVSLTGKELPAEKEVWEHWVANPATGLGHREQGSKRAL